MKQRRVRSSAITPERTPRSIVSSGPSRGLRSVVRTGSWTLGVNVGAKAQALAILAAGGISDGIAGVGIATAGYAFAVLGAVIADFGYSTEVVRFVARNPYRAAVATALRGGSARGLAAGAAGALLAAVWLPGSWWIDGMVGVTAVAAFWVALFSQTLYGLFRHRAAALTLFSVRAASAVALIVFAAVWGGPGIVAALCLGEVSCALVLGAATRRAYRDVLESEVHERISRRYYWLGIGGVVSSLINRRDSALISTVASESVVGVYSIASQLQNAVTTLALVPAGALPSHVAQAHRAGRSESAIVIRLASIVAALSFLGGGLVVALSTLPVLQPYLGKGTDLRDLPVALALVMLGAPLGAAGGVLLSTSVALERHRDVGIAWIILGVLGVSIIALLTASFGVIGAAAGALVRDGLFLAAGIVCWRRALGVGSHEGVVP